MNLSDKLIMYIGNKPEKRDTVAGSNLYWPGNGTILKVEHTAAIQLIRHPDVWIEVDEEGEPINPQVATKKKGGKAPEPEPAADEDKGDIGIEDVKAAIFGLDREDPDSFTDTGKPKLKAVAAAMGVDDLDVKLVNAAWKEIDG